MPPDYGLGEFVLDFHVSHETQEKLKIYHGILLKWQNAINLISPRSAADAWKRHFADSAQLAAMIPENIRTITDLGSGAGFPGMVLAILRPDLEVHLIESDSRKCEFLRTVSRETGAKAKINNERVEAVIAELKPDLITARGFAPLREIISMCLPLMLEKPGAVMILLKGANAQNEIDEARKAYQFNLNSMEAKTGEGGRILIIKDISRNPE